VIVVLVRHARAGDRAEWEGDDRLRPLDKKGRRQAKGLVALLEPYPIDGILSSPYIRCMQTMEPLAGARGLPLQEAEELAEGKTDADVLELLDRLEAECPVLSTHGDIVVELLGDELRKGETQVFEYEGGELRPRERLPRPR
jgi:8-oxo-dGTP diphosphatase